MASSSAHPSFASRPYTSNLGKLPDRSAAGFGSSSGHQAREAQRLERERERAERERLETNPLAELTEEQREEINEAVSTLSFSLDSGE